MVSVHSSEETGGGGLDCPASHFAYTEKFKELFPYYLAIGMTYEQYWEQDCELVKYYRKSAEIKQELKNQHAWIMGAYIYEALLDVSPVFNPATKKGTKVTPYRSEPFDLFNRHAAEREERKERESNEQAKAMLEAFAIGFNQRFQEKGGDGE